MSNELVTTDGTYLYRISTDAANICKDIVLATARKIGDRNYVQVEGWQAIAVAHGCAASSVNVERVDGGFRATGQIRRMSDGALIAEAEGFVGEDEATWFGGIHKKWKWGKERGEKIWWDETLPKRADYAIRAMAQTRAISRACRSAFAHVVVMMNANLSTTPAEEVPEGGFNDDRQHDDKAHEAPKPFELSPEEQKLADEAKAYADEIALCDTEEKLTLSVKRHLTLTLQLVAKLPKYHQRLFQLIDERRKSFVSEDQEMPSSSILMAGQSK